MPNEILVHFRQRRLFGLHLDVVQIQIHLHTPYIGVEYPNLLQPTYVKDESDKIEPPPPSNTYVCGFSISFQHHIP